MFYFSATDSRLQFQELQLCVGEFFAAGSVLLDSYQTQSFFQYPDLILCEPERSPDSRYAVRGGVKRMEDRM